MFWPLSLAILCFFLILESSESVSTIPNYDTKRTRSIKGKTLRKSKSLENLKRVNALSKNKHLKTVQKHTSTPMNEIKTKKFIFFEKEHMDIINNLGYSNHFILSLINSLSNFCLSDYEKSIQIGLNGVKGIENLAISLSFFFQKYEDSIEDFLNQKNIVFEYLENHISCLKFNLKIFVIFFINKKSQDIENFRKELKVSLKQLNNLIFTLLATYNENLQKFPTNPKSLMLNFSTCVRSYLASLQVPTICNRYKKNKSMCLVYFDQYLQDYLSSSLEKRPDEDFKKLSRIYRDLMPLIKKLETYVYIENDPEAAKKVDFVCQNFYIHANFSIKMRPNILKDKEVSLVKDNE
ncbi:hypothetical protein EDEG_00110 [Edhazardia aedis USNM 41457]|uniref:Uncharacterized protein n=1 Tax=Edhazardia aedis (strain USNM 41457) TaxID=1003232 RepID=J9DQP8_EDHAE|nr:hypothetical protein EDEG_00110 [Edhazardia aedis USNM 41457]|eukprot:EJW04890.1 hypothetical protein EDEG_00110 [Edhazardia aedis USNM 41457]